MRKYSVRFGGGPGEKAAMTSLAIYPTIFRLLPWPVALARAFDGPRAFVWHAQERLCLLLRVPDAFANRRRRKDTLDRLRSIALPAEDNADRVAGRVVRAPNSVRPACGPWGRRSPRA